MKRAISTDVRLFLSICFETLTGTLTIQLLITGRFTLITNPMKPPRPLTIILILQPQSTLTLRRGIGVYCERRVRTICIFYCAKEPEKVYWHAWQCSFRGLAPANAEARSSPQNARFRDTHGHDIQKLLFNWLEFISIAFRLEVYSEFQSCQ